MPSICFAQLTRPGEGGGIASLANTGVTKMDAPLTACARQPIENQ